MKIKRATSSVAAGHRLPFIRSGKGKIWAASKLDITLQLAEKDGTLSIYREITADQLQK